MPKTNDFLRPFFIDFGRVLGASDLGVGPLLGSKNQFFLFFFRYCNFLSILKRFGRAGGGFWEGLGKAWKGFGRVWRRFGTILDRFGENLGSSHWPERGWPGESRAVLK